MLPLLLGLLSTDSLAVRQIVLAPEETVSTAIVGSGPPVVLINGLIGGTFGYRKIMPALATLGFQAIAIEPLGLGFSSRPSRADYSLTAQADRIAAILDTLGISNALVIAHSLGGSIAFRLAYRRPELVRGIVSIDGGPAESAATPGLRRAMKWAPLLKLFVGRGTLRREVHSGLIKNSSDTTWLTPEVLDGYTAPSTEDVGATINALRGMARAREPDSLRSHLSQIVVPVRLLVGMVPHESAILPAETELLHELLPNFAVDSVPGSGQLVHEERPEVVIEAVLHLDCGTRADCNTSVTAEPTKIP